jgi:hypothetical protein
MTLAFTSILRHCEVYLGAFLADHTSVDGGLG